MRSEAATSGGAAIIYRGKKTKRLACLHDVSASRFVPEKSNVVSLSDRDTWKIQT
jgi:hypothetical protein